MLPTAKVVFTLVAGSPASGGGEEFSKIIVRHRLITHDPPLGKALSKITPGVEMKGGTILFFFFFFLFPLSLVRGPGVFCCPVSQHSVETSAIELCVM